MDKSEKKALFSFLIIYVGSTFLLLTTLFYFYYEKEKEMITTQCRIEMISSANELKANILNAHMEHKDFVPYKLKDLTQSYGLFSKDGRTIYSELKKDFTSLDNLPNQNLRSSFYSETIDVNQHDIDIKYIVVESSKLVSETKKLQFYMLVILILTTIFVAFIGFMLSRILLKPLKEKVAQLDKFIKDSAHELNTPIAVLMTSTSTIKDGRNLEKMLKYVTSSAKQISQIYNDIHYRAFENKDEVMDEEIDLKELVEESIIFFTDIADTKNIIINKELEDCNIQIDRTKVQKLFNNLLSNAIKYSNKDSKVIIRLKNSTLEVEDFGIGINETEQKTIFKRYKRGENSEGGFGIGLDIVNEVCTMYNLKLTLKSRPKEGSTFSVDFKNILINRDF